MTAKTANFDESTFRAALGRFPTGVTVITTEDKRSLQPSGLTISSFTSLSLDPPLVLWTLSNKAASLPIFESSERYVIHVLSASQLALARRFSTGTPAERFQTQATTRTQQGTLMLDEPHLSAWFECYNVRQYKGGDHMIFIGQVERCHHNEIQPLVYHAGDFDLTPSTQSITGL